MVSDRPSCHLTGSDQKVRLTVITDERYQARLRVFIKRYIVEERSENGRWCSHERAERLGAIKKLATLGNE